MMDGDNLRRRPALFQGKRRDLIKPSAIVWSVPMHLSDTVMSAWKWNDVISQWCQRGGCMLMLACGLTWNTVQSSLRIFIAQLLSSSVNKQVVLKWYQFVRLTGLWLATWNTSSVTWEENGCSANTLYYTSCFVSNITTRASVRHHFWLIAAKFLYIFGRARQPSDSYKFQSYGR